MTEKGFRDILGVLCSGHVEFILIGGLAAMAHGSARATVDVDVVYRRTSENMHRIELTLAPYAPYLRGAPLGLPFRFDLATISSGLNFTLRTSIGDLDLLGEVVGGGDFERLVTHSETIQLFGNDMQCVTLAKLIELKRAAGRPKDLDAIAELETLQNELEQ